MIGTNRISMSNFSNQKGFTLVEALVAFVILTVGLLGASLFHSYLISESVNSRAEYLASTIGETEVEKARFAIAQTASSAQLATNIAAVLTTSNIDSQSGYTYSVSMANYSFNTAGTTTSGIVTFDLNVTWTDEADSVSRTFSIPQTVAWNLGALAQPDNVALESESSSYEGDIKLPTGTLTALSREVLTADQINTVQATSAIASGSSLSVHKYDVDGLNDHDGDDYVVAFKIDDDTYVQLAELSQLPNELIIISGKILNDSSNPSPDAFGCPFTYTASAAASTQTMCDNAPTEDYLDVGGTGGAGCLVYKFENTNTQSNPNKDPVWQAQYGNYLCVVGTGWNGGITPRINGDDPEVDAKVCSPQQRSFKYRIVDPGDIADFEADWADAGSDSVRQGLVASAALVGQSGLVRFFREGDPLASDEGVYWSDYFAHAHFTSSATANYDFLQEPLVYKSLGDNEYSPYGSGTLVHQPGDLPFQNFYLADTSDTCDEYVTDDLSVASLFSTYWPSGVSEAEFPGWNYEPGDYDVDMYNIPATYSVQGNRTIETGGFVVGYTLARYAVTGTLFLATSNSLPSDYIIAGNPEPQISISCDISDTSEESDGGYAGYEYSCGVPTGWTGFILAYPIDAAASEAFQGVTPSDYDLADVCSPDPLFSSYTQENYDKASSTATPSASTDDLGLYQYYFQALNEPASLGSASFDYTGLGYFVVASAANSTIVGEDFYFKDNGNCP